MNTFIANKAILHTIAQQINIFMFIPCIRVNSGEYNEHGSLSRVGAKKERYFLSREISLKRLIKVFDD